MHVLVNTSALLACSHACIAHIAILTGTKSSPEPSRSDSCHFFPTATLPLRPDTLPPNLITSAVSSRCLTPHRQCPKLLPPTRSGHAQHPKTLLGPIAEVQQPVLGPLLVGSSAMTCLGVTSVLGWVLSWSRGTPPEKEWMPRCSSPRHEA